MLKRLILAFGFLMMLSCKEKTEYLAIKSDQNINLTAAHQFYRTALVQSIEILEEIKKRGINNPFIKDNFRNARREWKKAEPFASYLNPAVGHRVNGPALPVFKEDNSRVMPPIGLQKIEESVFEGKTNSTEFQEELKITIGLMKILLANIDKRDLTPRRFFVATHQQLLRVLSHSITGFDTPVSHLGIEEAAVSLSALKRVYLITLQSNIRKKSGQLDESFVQQIDAAKEFINNNTSFESFDRFTFIRDHLNPITASWVQIRNSSGFWEGADNMPFNFDAPSFFEENSFDPEYFMQNVNRKNSTEKIALGEKLFFDKKLSKNGSMACATCHIPSEAYADGRTFSVDNRGNDLSRNTPTLINSIYQRGFFWDGRSEDLMAQISSVFTNEKEFNTGVHNFSNRILEDSTYIELFKESFGQIPRGNTELVKALSAYIATLNGMNSKFDRNITGKANNFSKKEKRGFNLFAGKALCATCHFLPITNGTVPPFYTETEKEVIGVPDTAMNIQLDDDTGFYWSYEVELHKGMFKTPTVRNIALTAPYMHNGVYTSLKQVIDFYNQGGGAGMGFDLPHQTLPFDNLELSEEEQDALVAYLETLTDSKVAENPVESLVN